MEASRPWWHAKHLDWRDSKKQKMLQSMEGTCVPQEVPAMCDPVRQRKLEKASFPCESSGFLGLQNLPGSPKASLVQFI